jgi:toxin ParE1/3/4
MFVYLSRQAEVDFGELLDYVGSHNLRAAASLGEEIRAAFKSLQRFPESGQRCPQYAANLRCIIVRPYVIYYVVLDDKVEIRRILQGARDHDGIFDIE